MSTHPVDMGVMQISVHETPGHANNAFFAYIKSKLDLQDYAFAITIE